MPLFVTISGRFPVTPQYIWLLVRPSGATYKYMRTTQWRKRKKTEGRGEAGRGVREEGEARSARAKRERAADVKEDETEAEKTNDG